MSSTSKRDYVLVSPEAGPKSPAEKLNMRPGNKKLVLAVLVASGLCFVGAALVVTTSSSRSQRFRSPADAPQFQQSVIRFNELNADTMSVPIIIRDFSEEHPDFENHPWNTVEGYDGNKPTLGIVKDKLGSDGKPQYNGGKTVASEESFNQWFNDDPVANTRVNLNLNLTRTSSGSLVADHPDFFPLDFLGNLHPIHGHNYWFTLEMHTVFKYHGGETFKFRGDDDLWVFINGSLALDLGGMHIPLEKEIQLDGLGLNKGQAATLSLFFAERHTVQSNFRVETTIQIGADLCTAYPHMQLGIVPQNNLGGSGPDSGPEELVLRGSKLVPNEDTREIELALTVKTGSSYEKGSVLNGLFGDYGIVSVKAGTEVTVQFSFRDPGTTNLVLLEDVYLSFLDLDQGDPASAKESVEIGGYSQVIIMPESQIQEEQLANGLTRFSATEMGSTLDNPRDPNLLTVDQRNRVVTLKFTDTSGMEATLGCSPGVTNCDFMFAVEPSLKCSQSPGGVGGKPPETRTATTTTMTGTTTTVTQAVQFCVIDIEAFNLRLICFSEKQWWMFWK